MIIFRSDGRFYYSFSTPTEKLPRNLGHYRFEHATDLKPVLSVRSAHAGTFALRISDTGDRVFLSHPALFTGERVYERKVD